MIIIDVLGLVRYLYWESICVFIVVLRFVGGVFFVNYRRLCFSLFRILSCLLFWKKNYIIYRNIRIRYIFIVIFLVFSIIVFKR